MSIILVIVLMLVVIALLLFIAKKVYLRWFPGLLLRAAFLLMIFVGLLAWENETNDDFSRTPEILLIDRSASVRLDRQILGQQFAEGWQKDQSNRLVLAYAGKTSPVILSDWPSVFENDSDLPHALEYAGEIIGEQAGRIVVVSDGMVPNWTEVDKRVDLLSGQGIIIDTIYLTANNEANDLYVGSILGPNGVWQHSQFSIIVPIHAPTAGESSIQIMANGESKVKLSVILQEGMNYVRIPLIAGKPGIMLVQAMVLWDGDKEIDNNTIYAAYEVYPPPTLLLVTRSNVDVEIMRDLLQSEGAKVDLTSPEKLSSQFNNLLQYDTIIIHNLLSKDLSYEQMQALRLYVTQLGRGLLFIGGRNSYSLGGYENTLLEPLLPIIVTPPERIQRVPTSILLVLDRSGSMVGDKDSNISPIDLTKEAATRVIEILRPDDYLGVLTFSGRTNWDIEIREIGEGIRLRQALDAVSQIQAGGGTLMYQALLEAVFELIKANPTENKHIVLMSDGVSGDGSRQEFLELVRTAQADNITISTISLGNESDPEMLALIADEGKGRFYQIFDPEDLPKVMLAESKAVRSENIQKGETNLLLGIDNHPALAGFQINDLPRLISYNAVQSKAEFGAEDILISANFYDPLLSTWQVGLGHVTAWMGDLGEDWAPDMKNWNQQGEFWMQIIQYGLPDPKYSNSEIQVDVDEQEVKITAYFQTPTGKSMNGLEPELLIWVDHAEPIRYELRQIASGEYQIQFPLLPYGAYYGLVRYENNENLEEILAPIVINYPEEWRPDELNLGKKNLRRWAEIAGGEYITIDEEVQRSDVMESDLNNTLFYIVLIILVITWPVEIAIRRWRMPWRKP